MYKLNSIDGREVYLDYKGEVDNNELITIYCNDAFSKYLVVNLDFLDLPEHVRDFLLLLYDQYVKLGYDDQEALSHIQYEDLVIAINEIRNHHLSRGRIVTALSDFVEIRSLTNDSFEERILRYYEGKN